jgi:hypothetical protein
MYVRLKLLINKGKKKGYSTLRFKVFFRQAKNNKITWKKNKTLPPEVYLTIAEENKLLKVFLISIY